MEYVILKEKNPKQLCKEVMRHLERGFELQGGVSISYCEGMLSDLIYAQALIRETRKP